MGILLKTAIKLRGAILKCSFDRATANPQKAQAKLLRDLLRQSRSTVYGKEHQFSGIVTHADFIANVPVNTFSDLSAYIDRIMDGESQILSVEPPFMFNLTSGTTSKPKYIPLTPCCMRKTAQLSTQWICRALQSHPSLLDHSFLCIAGSSVEGLTQAGIPYGSASGILYERLPRILHRSFAIPFAFSNIKDYNLRYYAIARFALEKKVSLIVTPNPATLLSISKIGIKYQEMIIQSITNGTFYSNWDSDISTGDLQIIREAEKLLRPNAARAEFLRSIRDRHGYLLPAACWPELKLIGCWLGGSAGFQADKLEEYFGTNIKKRDIGLLASEGALSIPIQDETTAGILAIQNNYYEFLPANETHDNIKEPLLCHQIKEGGEYRVLLTNSNGLYRYDIHDIIRVDGFYNQTPLISFVRKSEEMLNITGEKIHANHLITVINMLKKVHGISVVQFKAVADYRMLRYDLLMQTDQKLDTELLREIILPFIDRSISEINIEYAAKRKSGRLICPRLLIMNKQWAESEKRALLMSGRRDVQLKWNMTATKLSEADTAHIEQSIESDNL